MEKLRPNSDLTNYVLYSAFKKQTGPTKGAKLASIDDPITPIIDSFKRNEGAKMLTIEKRDQEANERIAGSRYQQQSAQSQAQDEKLAEIQCRNYIIGELVSKYFPEVCEIEPGTSDENEGRFQLVEAFLAALANDEELVKQLKEKASFRCIEE